MLGTDTVRIGPANFFLLPLVLEIFLPKVQKKSRKNIYVMNQIN